MKYMSTRCHTREKKIDRSLRGAPIPLPPPVLKSEQADSEPWHSAAGAVFRPVGAYSIRTANTDWQSI